MAFCYHHHKADRKKIAVSYDDCYFKCEYAAKQWDEKRRTYCDECPYTAAKERFFESARSTFEERFAEELSRAKFEKLLHLVRNVAAFEGLDGMSSKASYLLTLYLEEKRKWERQEKANRPTA